MEHIQSIQEELKQLVHKGRQDVVFDRLLKQLLKPSSELYNMIGTLSARRFEANKQQGLGTIQFRDAEIPLNNVNYALQQFIDKILPEDLRLNIFHSPPQEIPTPSTKPAFSTHHKHTCDRVEQDSAFEKEIKKVADKRILFFYLHGEDIQSHKGLFERFVARIKGADLDYLGRTASKHQVKSYCIPMAQQVELNSLEDEIKRMTMAAMQIQDHDMVKLKDQCFASVLQKSAEFKDLKSEDSICIHLILDAVLWDTEATPQVARDFIQNFCLNGYEDHFPKLYFFLSVEYDEFDNHVGEEVEDALQNAEYFKALGALNNVVFRDVNQWFKQYAVYWDTKTQMKESLRKHFDPAIKELPMEDVEQSLGKVINEINNSEKHEAR